jgi:hypothetical protein
MSFRRSLGRLGRRVVIDSVTALGLDHLTRSIERRERRRRRAQVVRVLFHAMLRANRRSHGLASPDMAHEC